MTATAVRPAPAPEAVAVPGYVEPDKWTRRHPWQPDGRRVWLWWPCLACARWHHLAVRLAPPVGAVLARTGATAGCDRLAAVDIHVQPSRMAEVWRNRAGTVGSLFKWPKGFLKTDLAERLDS